jgi:hypothetical protein
MRQPKNLAVTLSVAGLLVCAIAHQALTKDAPKKLVVLSSTDIIGYTSPCG